MVSKFRSFFLLSRRVCVLGGNHSERVLGVVDGLRHGAPSALPTRCRSAAWSSRPAAVGRAWAQAFSLSDGSVPALAEGSTAYMVWTHVAWVAIGFAVIVTFCGLIDEASPSFPLLALSKPAKFVAFALPQTFEQLYALYLKRKVHILHSEEDREGVAERHPKVLGAQLACSWPSLDCLVEAIICALALRRCSVYTRSIRALVSHNVSQYLKDRHTFLGNPELVVAKKIDPYEATSIFYTTAMRRIHRALCARNPATRIKCGSQAFVPGCPATKLSSAGCRRRNDLRTLLEELSPYVAANSGGPFVSECGCCPGGTPLEAAEVGVLSHKKKAAFWLGLVELFPNMIDYLCNPNVNPVSDHARLDHATSGWSHHQLSSNPCCLRRSLC